MRQLIRLLPWVCADQSCYIWSPKISCAPRKKYLLGDVCNVTHKNTHTCVQARISTVSETVLFLTGCMRVEVNIFGTIRRLNCEKTVGSVFRSIPVLFSKVLLVLEETERCLKTVVGAAIAEISQAVRS